MAKCDICGKTVANGNRISIARSHVSIKVNGENKKMHVCSKCLRSSKLDNE